MSKIDKKIDISKGILLGAGIMAVFILYLIYQQTITWQAMQQKISDEQGALGQASSQLQSLKQLESQAANLQEQLRQVEMTLPTEPGEDFLVKELQRQAHNSGMKLLEIQFDKQELKKDYTEMPFKFAMEGPFKGLQFFLRELQQGPRTVVIRELKISKAEDAPMMRVDLVGSAFYVSDK